MMMGDHLMSQEIPTLVMITSDELLASSSYLTTFKPGSSELKIGRQVTFLLSKILLQVCVKVKLLRKSKRAEFLFEWNRIG